MPLKEKIISGFFFLNRRSGKGNVSVIIREIL